MVSLIKASKFRKISATSKEERTANWKEKTHGRRTSGDDQQSSLQHSVVKRVSENSKECKLICRIILLSLLNYTDPS